MRFPRNGNLSVAEFVLSSLTIQMNLTSGRLAAVLLILPLAALAQSNDVNELAPVTTGTLAKAVQKMDSGHESLSRYVSRLADRLDCFLHNSIVDDEEEVEVEPSTPTAEFVSDRNVHDYGKGSYIELSPVVTFDKDGVEFGSQFSAKLRLRQFSNRLKLYVDSFEDDEDIIGGVTGRERDNANARDRRGTAGLKYMLVEHLNYKSSLSTGLSFKPEPVAKIRLNNQFSHDLGSWRAFFFQRFFWESDDGFGEKSTLEFRHPLFRHGRYWMASSALWSETSEGVDLGQTFNYAQPFTRSSVIALKLGIAGHTEPSTIVDRYAIRLPYRKRIHSDWMFLEIEPGVNFDNDNDWDAAPQIIVRLDLLFGDAPP